MIKATTIDEVVSGLDYVIDWSKQKESRIGYFATLYRKMTIAVRDGIANNSFDDGKRMEVLDVIFANRYLQAWYAYTNKQKCSNAWCAAFDACENSKLIVLQHLILGINTHINLDLGIAAAEACPAAEIQSLSSDFNKINTVIAGLTENVQNDLVEVWPPLGLLIRLAKHRQEPLLNFSIDTARKVSWQNAVVLSQATGNNRENYINIMDNAVSKIADRITNPGFVVELALRPIRRMESKKVSDVISLLHD